jgi:hypothetical protein
MISSMSIAHGLSWTYDVFISIDDRFIFLFIGVYATCVFSMLVLGGFLSPSLTEPPTGVFMVSIPLVLLFNRDGVLF